MSEKNTVSEKNTKSEILRAYDELLAQIKESSQPSKKAEKDSQEKKEVIKTAASLSSENIISGLASLKLDIMKSLDQVSEQLIAKQKAFATLENAIALETKNLEELHDIRVEADSLAALMAANRETKAKFENEMDTARIAFDTEIKDKKAIFKRQQEQQELEVKEAHDKLLKERTRENEEYLYKLKLERARDTDVYESKKQALLSELSEKSIAFEKSCEEREARLKTKEIEFEDLRTQVADFPQKLEREIKNCEEQITTKLTAQYQYETNLKAKEYDGELKLLKQTIAALELKIKEKDTLIEQLTQKTNQATLQIQDIAVKAIEGASASRAFQGMFALKTEAERVNKA